MNQQEHPHLAGTVSRDVSLGSLPDETLLTRRQASEYLQMTVRFLECAAIRGDGPPMVRVSNRGIRYRLGDLRQWIASRVVQHTGQEIQ